MISIKVLLVTIGDARFSREMSKTRRSCRRKKKSFLLFLFAHSRFGFVLQSFLNKWSSSVRCIWIINEKNASIKSVWYEKENVQQISTRSVEEKESEKQRTRCSSLKLHSCIYDRFVCLVLRASQERRNDEKIFSSFCLLSLFCQKKRNSFVWLNWGNRTVVRNIDLLTDRSHLEKS